MRCRAQGAWLTARHFLFLSLLLLALFLPSASMAGVTSAQGSNVNDVTWGNQGDMAQPAAAAMGVLEAYPGAQGVAYPDGDGEADSRYLSDGPSHREAFGTEDLQVGCRELRAKRYISDGFCTSTKPINEVVCAGTCLPVRDLPWYAAFIKVWASTKEREYQCEEDVVRRKSVHLLCRNGKYRTYRIKVVKSCKCSKMADSDEANSTDSRKKKKKGEEEKRKRKSKNNNPSGEDGQRRRKGGSGRGKGRKGRPKNRRTGGEEGFREVFQKGVLETDAPRDTGVTGERSERAEVVVDEVLDLSHGSPAGSDHADRPKKERRKTPRQGPEERVRNRDRGSNPPAAGGSFSTPASPSHLLAPTGRKDPVMKSPSR